MTAGPISAGLGAQALVALLCLGVVLLLILGAAKLARAVPALRVQTQTAGNIALCGSLALDRQRRLHLVEVSGCQALVLTGGGADVMIALPAKPCV